MRVLAGVGGVILIALMLSEFFVAYMLPRRFRRDPRIARGLNRALWRPWRAVARRLSPASADTMLGFFGPLALLFQLLTWTVGLIFGFALLEWAAVGRGFGHGLLFSSGLFLSAEAVSGSTTVHVIALVEAAVAIGVLFSVIGYLPSVYGSFSRREIAVSQLGTRAGSPPAAGAILCRAARRERWRELEQDLRAWEEWVAELMETHLSYPILGYYRSQHVNQNWLAALTAMVDVAAFVTAVEEEGENEAAEVTYAIGRHALADLAHQYRVRYGHADRLSDEDFERLYTAVEDAVTRPVGREEARRRLSELRGAYEPKAQGLAEWLAPELPPWLPLEGRARGPPPTAPPPPRRGSAPPPYSTCSGRSPRTFAIGPSTARITSASEISPAGRASQYPPSTPRWLCTRPACLRSSRMFSRNLSGISCACAIRSPLTGPSPAAASSAPARTA